MSTSYLDKLKFSDGTNIKSLVSGFMNRLSKFLKKNPDAEDVFFTVQFHDRAKVLEKLKKKGDRYIYVPKNKVFIKKVSMTINVENITENVILNSDESLNEVKTKKIQQIPGNQPRVESSVEKHVLELGENELFEQRSHVVNRVLTCIPDDCKIKTLVQISQDVFDECPFCDRSSTSQPEVKEECAKCKIMEEDLIGKTKVISELMECKKEMSKLIESQRFMIEKLELETPRGRSKAKITPIEESKSKEASNVDKYNSGLISFNELTFDEQNKVRNMTAKSLGLYVDDDDEESQDGSIYSEDSAVFE